MEITDGSTFNPFFVKPVYTIGAARTFYVWALHDRYRRGVSYNQIFFCICEPAANSTRSDAFLLPFPRVVYFIMLDHVWVSSRINSTFSSSMCILCNAGHILLFSSSGK